ncbi:MAG: ribonuclease HI family protein [Pseudobdellovibrionaceae bacterium]|uniref:ribonuclease HI family protein n=1 Tax=Oligoflexus sp. TaxID=1971216 RepID=UPI0027C0D4B5|nr:ribonuclease HI family protein [Oligoflexus sp.]MDQ3234174.1 ribonuclease HI family protein [Pseudobdellovibrionaceae bacterium]HYX38021.1 ribonuclease HI family protein [Oligoflexus sp.]
MPAECVTIYFDGGSRGNPGPAAGAAFTAYDGGHERVCYMESATNNEAEYRGLLMAIELAQSLGLTRLELLGDSKLVVMQVTGEWQVKHPMMGELRLLVVRALASIPHWSLRWIPREQNGEADRVANEEMDRRLGIEPKPPMEVIPVTPGSPAQGIPSAAAIAQLNSLGNKAGFKELLKLKVGGSDAFSRTSLISLAQTLPNFSDIEQAFARGLSHDPLTKDLADEARKKLLLNALRWSARGLQGDLPLRKVLVDCEMAQKMRGKK